MIKKICFFLMIAFLFQGCYVGRILLYQTAGIYDYKIFPNHVIKASSHPDSLPCSVFYNTKEYPASLFPMLEQLKTTAYLVIKNDSVLFEKYWNEGGADVISSSFSMSKSIVSLLVGFALQDGYIKSVDQFVCEYLPNFEDGCSKHLRVRDLLTMSSGIAWKENYINPFGQTAKAYYGRHLYSQMMRLKIEQTPGYTFRYLSANTQLLGLLLEKATGKSLSQYAEEKLWQPLGAEHDALWSLDQKEGNEKAYCNFYATAHDFARIGIFCLHQGEWKSKPLLSKEYIKQSFTPAKNLTDRYGNSVDFYGYQWWMMTYKNMKITMACGLYGQYIIMIPDKNLVIVRLGHRTSKEYKGHFNADVYSYIEAGLSIAE